MYYYRYVQNIYQYIQSRYQQNPVYVECANYTPTPSGNTREAPLPMDDLNAALGLFALRLWIHPR